MLSECLFSWPGTHRRLCSFLLTPLVVDRLAGDDGMFGQHTAAPAAPNKQEQYKITVQNKGQGRGGDGGGGPIKPQTDADAIPESRARWSVIKYMPQMCSTLATMNLRAPKLQEVLSVSDSIRDGRIKARPTRSRVVFFHRSKQRRAAASAAINAICVAGNLPVVHTGKGPLRATCCTDLSLQHRRRSCRRVAASNRWIVCESSST